jgi:hypothetical protein
MGGLVDGNEGMSSAQRSKNTWHFPNYAPPSRNWLSQQHHITLTVLPILGLRLFFIILIRDVH